MRAPAAELAGAAALALAGAYAWSATGALDAVVHTVTVAGVATSAVARAAAPQADLPTWLLFVEVPVIAGFMWWWLRGAPGRPALQRP